MQLNLQMTRNYYLYATTLHQTSADKTFYFTQTGHVYKKAFNVSDNSTTNTKKQGYKYQY